jgi:hypothetical protein
VLDDAPSDQGDVLCPGFDNDQWIYFLALFIVLFMTVLALNIVRSRIGGLGAHLAGQMLAEAGVLGLGLNGSHFSSYGSEKKGTPLKSYIRFCSPDQTVRTNLAPSSGPT